MMKEKTPSELRNPMIGKSFLRLKHKEAQLNSKSKVEILFQDYKKWQKNIRVYVVLALFVLLFLFLQMCFSETLYGKELALITKIQGTLKVSNSGFFHLESFGAISLIHMHYLILASIASLVFAFDYMTGVKVLFKYLLGMELCKMITFFRAEPRPFWLNSIDSDANQVVAYRCDPTYGSPDLLLIQILWFVISFQNTLQNSKIKFTSILDKVILTIFIILGIFFCGTKYIGGEIFLSQLADTILLTIILFIASKLLMPWLKQVIEKCTISSALENKALLQYYLCLLSLNVLEFLMLMYQDKYDKNQLMYMENYVRRSVIADQVQRRA